MNENLLAMIIFTAIGALMLDEEGWVNVLSLSGLILLCFGLVWMGS